MIPRGLLKSHSSKSFQFIVFNLFSNVKTWFQRGLIKNHSSLSFFNIFSNDKTWFHEWWFKSHSSRSFQLNFYVFACVLLDFWYGLITLCFWISMVLVSSYFHLFSLYYTNGLNVYFITKHSKLGNLCRP